MRNKNNVKSLSVLLLATTLLNIDNGETKLPTNIVRAPIEAYELRVIKKKITQIKKLILSKVPKQDLESLDLTEAGVLINDLKEPLNYELLAIYLLLIEFNEKEYGAKSQLFASIANIEFVEYATYLVDTLNIFNGHGDEAFTWNSAVSIHSIL